MHGSSRPHYPRYLERPVRPIRVCSPRQSACGLFALALAALYACADSPTSPTGIDPASLAEAARSLTLSADPVFVGAGDIHADCVANGDSITAVLLDGIEGTVFTTGDNTEHGTAADYANCYATRWGRHQARTRPALGDNDVLVPGAGPYFDYFGSAAGPAGLGYYSYNLDDWHIIVLDSNQPAGTTSPQYLWLKDDLESHPGACSLAIWHEARFSSTRETLNSKMKAVWKLLDTEGADLVLNGHPRRLTERDRAFVVTEGSARALENAIASIEITELATAPPAPHPHKIRTRGVDRDAGRRDGRARRPRAGGRRPSGE